MIPVKKLQAEDHVSDASPGNSRIMADSIHLQTLAFAAFQLITREK